MKNFRTAVILCGGRGTRLGSIGKKIPKTLVKIHGKEILWYIIKILKKNKFNHIILPLGYKGNMIKKLTKKYKNLFNNIVFVDTGEKSNIGKRIFLIQNKIKSDNFLLLNGDAIFDIKLDKIFRSHENTKKDITFITGEITYPYGTVGVEKSKVVDFNRNLVYESIKVRKRNNYTAYNYTGMSIIKTKQIVKLKKYYKSQSNFETGLFPKLIKSFKARIVKLVGFWHSIDNVKDIEAVNKNKKFNKKFLQVKKLKKILINQ